MAHVYKEVVNKLLFRCQESVSITVSTGFSDKYIEN